MLSAPIRNATSRRSANDEQVYDALRKSPRPMSAYEILGALKGSHIKAAVQVYRALERLMAGNRVHRIESRNAFVACSCAAHSTPAGFYICESCGAAYEFDPGPVLGAMRPAAAGFEVQQASIELRGLCLDCGAKGARPA
ncbi:MAG: Fur family transcriptional regulator [Aestuariivirga sp.]|uniref:Fur family transcriptional regulator n=1 Tax=Aestuariivirga sp. TaxID=2650926 RepID=UPI0038CFC50D